MRSQFNRFFENPLMRRIYKNSGYLFSATGVAAVISLLQSILVRLDGYDYNVHQRGE
jgi:hypothetical protein